MKSILEEIYYGNLHMEEQIVPTDPEYQPINRKISELIEDAKQRFSESDFAALEEILDLNGESNSILAKASFVHGFTMGALVMVEVLGGEGKGVGE
ncbi:hypothetical protein G8C92_25895 [Paenibacillus donghaensis]|uniref:DUF6809 family protein n=1 Tax=Paenibacillus donghaensis TaxID=414771 RepID=UPI0018839527|nr:DUF6809 family protein [Paenibacillus donghaensis]MBE9917450.1 hypothetical protein [Paenibacillus donghaensis]